MSDLVSNDILQAAQKRHLDLQQQLLTRVGVRSTTMIWNRTQAWSVFSVTSNQACSNCLGSNWQLNSSLSLEFLTDIYHWTPPWSSDISACLAGLSGVSFSFSFLLHPYSSRLTVCIWTTGRIQHLLLYFHSHRVFYNLVRVSVVFETHLCLDIFISETQRETHCRMSQIELWITMFLLILCIGTWWFLANRTTPRDQGGEAGHFVPSEPDLPC